MSTSNRAPDGLPYPHPRVAIDTREQLPLGFASPLICELLGGPWQTDVCTLATADYALLGPDGEPLDVCLVERKSLADLVGSVTARREPFMREMERLSAVPTPLVVVEAPIECLLGARSGAVMALREAVEGWAALAGGDDADEAPRGEPTTLERLRGYLAGLMWERERRSNVGARSLLGSTLSILVDHRIPVLFLPSRAWAEYAAAWVFRRAWRRWLLDHPEGLAAERRRLAGGDARAQVTAGAEEASDGARASRGGVDDSDRRGDRGGGGSDPHAGGAGDGETPARASAAADDDGGRAVVLIGDAGDREASTHGACGDGGPRADAAAEGAGVAHDAGEQGAAVGARTNLERSAGVAADGDVAHDDAAARGAPDDSDAGRGRAAPPEAMASAAAATGVGVVAPQSPLLTPVAELPCRCGGVGLGVAGFHYPRAIGCCYGPAPRPCAVALGQERASLDGLRRVRVGRMLMGRTPLWEVTPVRAPGERRFRSADVIMRDDGWPVLCDGAQPWVRPAAAARRDPLLGVAATSEEHARRRAARERPAAKARRRRAGA